MQGLADNYPQEVGHGIFNLFDSLHAQVAGIMAPCSEINRRVSLTIEYDIKEIQKGSCM